MRKKCTTHICDPCWKKSGPSLKNGWMLFMRRQRSCSINRSHRRCLCLRCSNTKEINIVVNGKAKKVGKNVLSFDDVALAYPTKPAGDILFTVVYHNADQEPRDGSLVSGRSVTERTEPASMLSILFDHNPDLKRLLDEGHNVLLDSATIIFFCGTSLMSAIKPCATACWLPHSR